MNEINFKGGFWIKRTQKPKKWNDLWNSIKEELPKRKCVFEEFNEQGDKFFAIKSVYDKAMLNILLRKKADFVFYPEINLKSRLDSMNIPASKEIIDSHTRVLKTKDEINQFIVEADARQPVVIPKYRWKPNDHLEKTYKVIGLSESECKTEIKNGITYIKDKKGKVLAKASPNGRSGINYVYVFPKNGDESSKKIAVTQEGDAYYFTPFELKTFWEKFMQNVKTDLGRKRPQTEP